MHSHWSIVCPNCPPNASAEHALLARHATPTPEFIPEVYTLQVYDSVQVHVQGTGYS